jgi:hypothetical protein
MVDKTRVGDAGMSDAFAIVVINALIHGWAKCQEKAPEHFLEKTVFLLHEI